MRGSRGENKKQAARAREMHCLDDYQQLPFQTKTHRTNYMPPKVLVCVMDLPEREVRACFEEFDVDNKGMKRKRDEREGVSSPTNHSNSRQQAT